MPEGHTIHRIARDHGKWFAGQRLGVLSPQGRFAEEADQLDGKQLRKVSARGKHLFYHWPRGRVVHIHLGLYGKFRHHRNPAPDPRGAVRVRMIGDERTFDLNGPNCCELIDGGVHTKLLERLGEDPLLSDAQPEKVWNRFLRSRSPVGTVLLNQSVIAGIGNVYRAEILFLLGIDPETPANQIDRSQFDAIWNLAVRLLEIGVKYNRIITVDRASVDVPLSRLRSSERTLIYKKKVCPRCGCRVKISMLANRKMYSCGRCQSSVSGGS